MLRGGGSAGIMGCLPSLPTGRTGAWLVNPCIRVSRDASLGRLAIELIAVTALIFVVNSGISCTRDGHRT